jgi:hypothetical protein
VSHERFLPGSGIIFILTSGGILLGALLRRTLPKHHLNEQRYRQRGGIQDEAKRATSTNHTDALFAASPVVSAGIGLCWRSISGQWLKRPEPLRIRKFESFSIGAG